MHTTDPIRDELDSDEQLIWSGQPRRGLVLSSSDFVMMPFGLFWTAFSFFVLHDGFSKHAPLAYLLFAGFFVLIGIYLLIGRLFVDARRRSRTFYGVTTRRVIICSRMFGQRVRSFPLRKLRDLSLDERSDGTGTITFGVPNITVPGVPMMNEWDTAAQFVAPAFEVVPQARTLYLTLCKLHERATESVGAGEVR